MVQFPPDWGLHYTSHIHSKAEGITDPFINKVRGPFVVIVTGAGKGLGAQISLSYCRAGVSGICISSRTQSDLDNLEKQLREINPKLDILSRICDTTKDDDVKKLADEVKSHFGRVDVVVANAGIISKYLYDADGTNRRLPIGVIEDLDFERVIDINLLGSVRVARHLIPLLAASKEGPQAFIIISSLAGHSTNSAFTPTAYNISKIAVNHLAEHIHNDHHDKEGIQAFALHPGAVVTPQTALHSTEKGDDWEQCMIYERLSG